MPSQILLKRSSTPTAVPTAGQLTPGEIAINTADGKIYTKNTAGQVVELTKFSTADGGNLIYVGPVNWQSVHRCVNLNYSLTTSAQLLVIDYIRLKIEIQYAAGQDASVLKLWRKITNTAITGNEADPSANGYTETLHNDEFNVNNNDWVTFTTTTSTKWPSPATIVVKNSANDAILDSFYMTGISC